jgi:hypothetical protein
MSTLQSNSVQISNAMRAKTADFFKMDVPRAASRTAARDQNPLRRNLNPLQDMDVWETNENMCFALWELMSRS